MNTLHTQGAGIPRAERRRVGPDDETQEIVIVPVERPAGDGEYDDDRRRADGLHLLHLTAAEHDIIDDLLIARVPVEAVGSRCAWTPYRLPAGDVAGVCRRPSPVLGGTFLIFLGE